jgi:superfamily II DNA or RNA helicase
MAAVYQAMTVDDARNGQILADVAEAVARGRHCLILTQRTAHLEALAATLRDRGHDPITLRGGMTTTARSAAVERLRTWQIQRPQADGDMPRAAPADGNPTDDDAADSPTRDAAAPSEGGPPLLVVATGSFIGEGFDCPPLDTLFLTTPIAFKGRLVQYVGRVLRPHPGKATAEVHDYHDPDTPILAASLAKRAPGYTSLGFPDPRKLPAGP